MDTFIETLRALLALVVLFYLYRTGKRERLRRARGWWYILLGFSLILFGTIVDMIEELPFFDRQVFTGSTALVSYLENVLGYMTGFLLLALGLVRWLPSIAKLEEAERELRETHDLLEVKVRDRTMELTQANEELDQANEEMVQANEELVQTNESLSIEITGRQRAEQELRTIQARLEHLLASTPAVIYSCRAYGDFGSTFVSDNVITLTGYSPEECLANPGFWKDGLHPDDAPLIQESFNELFEKGHMTHEYRFRNKDGEYKWVSDELRLVYGQDGKPLEMVGCWTDISRRKLAEDEIRKSEKFLADIIDSVQDGISILDRDLNIIRVNKAMQEWYSQSMPLVGNKCYAAYHGLDRVCDPCPSLRSLNEMKTAMDIVPYRTPDGQKGWLELYTFPLFEDGASEPSGVIEFVRNITSRRQAEAALKKSLQEKEVLLHEVHHRVKNNMATIISMLTLQSRSLKSQQARDALLDSQSRIRAMSLVHEKLYKKDELSSIRFEEYVSDLANYLINVYGGERVRPDLDLKMGDEVLGLDTMIPCGLILNELVTNSIKHAFADVERPEISIGFEVRDRVATLSYADNGCGIDESITPDSPDSFGLQIIRLLSKQLGGKVSIEKRDGARFIITFPDDHDPS